MSAAAHNTRRFVLAALAGAGAAGQARASAPVTMLAAASLQTALDGIAGLWRARGGAARLVYAASGALVRQLEQGAPADILATADLEWMAQAEARGLVRPRSRVLIAGNRLALIAGPDGPARLRIAPGFGLAAALDGGRLATADPASVPLGRYARAALTRLGIWDAVAPRIAPADTARTALALVARGEAPLGVVYATDARSEPRVRVLDVFPADSHPPIIYPAALTVRAGPDAGRFLAFTTGAAARTVWDRFGFIRPGAA